jgi:Clp amino terminal domain, pathogenicity island component
VNDLPLSEAITWAERRATTPAPPDQLAAAVALADELRLVSEELIGHFVTRARQADSSWADIGAALGISRQAAHERFALAPIPPAPAWPARFAPDAQAAMAQADTEMRRFRHQYLGTEHVLLGLLATGDNLAVTALAHLAVTEPAVRDAIGEIIGYGETPDGVCHGIVPRLKRALERARAEAKYSNHRLARSEHLLIAIAISDGVATEILRRHGIDERKLRDQIADLLPEAPEIADAIRRGPQRRGRRLRRA